MTEVNLLGALLLGLMGAGHCLGMCGGIISSLSMATAPGASHWPKTLFYQFGRIGSYTLFGITAGWLGQQASDFTPMPLLKWLSGILLILMALYLSGIWKGLSYLERLGKRLWDKISPLSKRFLPVRSLFQAFSLGAIWGWLPCGLVYTSLGYALTLASPLQSGIFMMAFGVGTLPATLLAGATSASLKSWLNRPPVKWASALFFLAFGIYIIYSLLQGGMPAHHH